MTNSQSSENVLEEILKGEHMAIYSYEKAIEKLKDLKIRQRLISFQTEHRQWIDILKAKIPVKKQSEPDLSIWSQTIVAGQFLVDQITGGQEDQKIVVRIRDGEEMGIKELRKFKDEIQDESGKDLLERMIVQAIRRVRELNRHVDQLRI